jgi:hypothetical protein
MKDKTRPKRSVKGLDAHDRLEGFYWNGYYWVKDEDTN